MWNAADDVLHRFGVSTFLRHVSDNETTLGSKVLPKQVLGPIVLDN